MEEGKITETAVQDDFELRPCEIGVMCTINPKMCGSGSVKLQIEIEERDEGPVPHLHVYLSQERDPKNCVCVQLNAAAYFDHHNAKPPKTFNKEQKERFIEIMTSLWSGRCTESITGGKVRPANGYEAAVRIWSDCYEDHYPNVSFRYDSGGFLIMPDYYGL